MTAVSAESRLVRTEDVADVSFLETRSNDVHVLIAKSPAFSDYDERPWLASIRAITDDGPQQATVLTKAVARQSLRLQAKLEVLDKIGLGKVPFAKMFRGCRVMIVSTNTAPAVAWSLGLERLLSYSHETRTSIYSQPDYDQMFMLSQVEQKGCGPTLRRSRHAPSARGTVAIYSEYLRTIGRPIISARAGVVGVGNVGSRIVQGLLDLGIGQLVVCDKREAAMSRFAEHPSVLSASLTELPQIDFDVLILSAHTGTLSISLARQLVKSKGRLVAVGGPEAGLDSSYDAIEALNDAGIDYLPSFLCGAVGLCANLEETIGIETSTAAKIDAVTVVVREAVRISRETRVPFNAALADLLDHRACP